MKAFNIIIFCLFFTISFSQSLINVGKTPLIDNVSTCADKDGVFFILGRLGTTYPFIFENQQGIDTLYESFISADKDRMILLKLDSTGNLIWSKKWDYSKIIHKKWSLNSDSQGNVIISTLMIDSIDLDPGFGMDIRMVDDYQFYQIVIKLNENGDYIWGHSTEGGNIVSDVYSAVDSHDNIYCVGSFYDTLDTQFGNGENIIVSANGAMNDYDLFLEKISSNGSIEWVKTIDQPNVFNSADFIVPRENGVTIFGAFNGDSLDIDPESAQQFLANPNPFNYASTFQLNYNENGAIVNWDILYSDQGIVLINDFTVGNNNELYLTGIGQGLVRSINGNFLGSNSFENENLMLKRNAIGNIEWMRHYPNNLSWNGLSFAGRLYVIGCFNDSIDFDPSDLIHQEVFYPTSNTNCTTFMLEVNENSNFYNVHLTQGPFHGPAGVVSNSNGRLMMLEYFDDSLTNLPMNSDIIIYDDPYARVVLYIWNNEFPGGIGPSPDKTNVFPNPVLDELTIVSKSQELINSIQLVDFTGKLVFELQKIDKSKITVDLKTLKSGLYNLILTTENGIEVLRIAKI